MVNKVKSTYNLVIIEDDLDVVVFYKDIFKQICKLEELHMFSFVSGSSELFKTIKEHNIDLFVVDVRLGNENGIELASAILKEVVSATFLFISGYDYSEEMFADLDGKCVYDFMLKPISIDELTVRSRGLLNVSKTFKRFLKRIKKIEGGYIDLKLDSLRDTYFEMVRRDRYMIQELERQMKSD